MNTLMSETLNARALSVRVTEDALSVDLADGRTVQIISTRLLVEEENDQGVVASF